MKIKILGIVGSPRRGGNTELLIQKALESAEKVDDVETELIRLCEKKIAQCNACDECVRKKTLCIIEDDMQEIYKKLMDADGIIIGSPVYLGTISAQLKTMMDRTYPFGDVLNYGLKNKVGAAIAVGNGKFGGQEATLGTVRNFLLNHGMLVVSGIPPEGHWQACGVATMPGEVRDDKWALESAGGVGLRVAKTAKVLKIAEKAAEDATIFMNSWFAFAVMPFLERYKENAKVTLRKTMYDMGCMYAKLLLDEVKPKERSLSTRNELLYRLFLPFKFGGQKLKRVELTEKRYVVRVHRCLWLEGFSKVVKKRENLCDLCELVSWFDRGFAETVNPKLRYAKYDWGLAKGGPYCEMILELKD